MAKLIDDTKKNASNSLVKNVGNKVKESVKEAKTQKEQKTVQKPSTVNTRQESRNDNPIGAQSLVKAQKRYVDVKEDLTQKYRNNEIDLNDDRLQTIFKTEASKNKSPYANERQKVYFEQQKFEEENKVERAVDFRNKDTEDLYKEFGEDRVKNIASSKIDYDSEIQGIDAKIGELNDFLRSSEDMNANIEASRELMDLNKQKKSLVEDKDIRDRFYRNMNDLEYLEYGSDREKSDVADVVNARTDSIGERIVKGTGANALGIIQSGFALFDTIKDVYYEGKADELTQKAIEDLKNGTINQDTYEAMLKNAQDFRDFTVNDERNVSQQLRREINQMNMEIQEGLSTPEKFAVDSINGTTNFLMQYALFSMIGTLGSGASILSKEGMAVAQKVGEVGSLVSMSSQSGTQKYYELIDEGYDSDTAFLNATATGLISYMTEKIGMDNFVAVMSGKAGQSAFGQIVNSISKGGLKNYYAQSIASGFMAEGLEELVEGLVDPIADAATLGTPIEYNAGDLFYSFLVGGMSGALMSGAGAIQGSRFVVNTKAQYNALSNDIETARQLLADPDITEEERGMLQYCINMGEEALTNFNELSTVSKGVTTLNDIVEPTSKTDGDSALAEGVYPEAVRLSQDIQSRNEALQKVTGEIRGITQEWLLNNGIDIDVDAYASQSAETRNEIKKTSDYAQKLGKKVRFSSDAEMKNTVAESMRKNGVSEEKINDLINDEALFVDGFVRDGEIVLNAERSRYGQLSTFVHELTHGTESSQYYNTLLTAVKEYLGENYDSMLSSTKEMYDGIADDSEHELVAKATQDSLLLGNEEFLENLVRYNESLAYRLLSGIRSLTDGSVKNQVERNFMKAFRDAGKNANENAQFLIGHDKDGIPVYDRAELVEALKKYGHEKSFKGKLKAYLNERYAGRLFNVADFYDAAFTNETAGEMVYPSRRPGDAEWYAKTTAFTDIEPLLAGAKIKDLNTDKKNEGKTFDHFTTEFGIKNGEDIDYWQFIVNCKVFNDGFVRIYDISSGDYKRSGNALSQGVIPAESTPSKNNISNSFEEVNKSLINDITNFTENYLKDMDFGDDLDLGTYREQTIEALQDNPQGIIETLEEYIENHEGEEGVDEAEALLNRVNSFVNGEDVNDASETVRDKVIVSGSEGSAAPQFSLSTWNSTDKETVKNDLVKTLGVSEQKADKWIEDVNGVAKMIADDRTRLDYEPNSHYSAMKSNDDYVASMDMSTLCKKRELLQGTIDEIQNRLPNYNIDGPEYTKVRQMMKDRGYEVACGFCYVESRRKELGNVAKKFIDSRNYSGLTIRDLTTVQGVNELQKSHPDIYEDFVKFNKKRGSGKVNLVESRTEYRGEIMKLTKAKIDKITRIGGLRLQSYSDFETPHMIDMMQIVIDMSRRGLTSQAYTKIPNFADAFGDTGIKINESLVCKGVDENGELIFDDVEGMPHDIAFEIRDRHPENVGTILVGKDDETIRAAMADDRIDFIIPFHRSGWGQAEYERLGITGYQDYTSQQKEYWITPKTKNNGKTENAPEDQFYPIDYWDYSKSGKENAETYLRLCADTGRIPKFSKFLVDNGDGSWSLQPDGSTDGYWKMLIDFKMYDNNGVGAPQQKVQPIFNNEVNQRIMNEYDGEHRINRFAPDVVEEFVSNVEKNGTRFSVSVDGDRKSLHKQRAIEEFGTTYNYRKAAYILDDGRYLDFAYPGQNQRTEDHRSISQVFDEDYDTQTQYLTEFMNEGNIRVVPEANGVDVSAVAEPTEKQYSKLRDYLGNFYGDWINVDISDENGYPVASIEYEPRTRSTKIISDLKQFYKDHTLPKEADKSQWTQYSLVVDRETQNFLENQDHVKVYRAMAMIDGKLYPPMASKLLNDETGKYELQEPSELGKWYRSDERPDLIDQKTGKFKLKKDNGGTDVNAAYNPYWHTSLSVLNDQFTSAYKRPNLVVVEGEVPSSELTSGYRAQYAKDPVGKTRWHSGTVSSQLKKQGKDAREVILSRWFKPTRVLSDNEVATGIRDLVDGTDVKIPYNVVTPSVREELERLGVPVGGQTGLKNKPSSTRFSLDSKGRSLTLSDARKKADDNNLRNNYGIFYANIFGNRNAKISEDSDAAVYNALNEAYENGTVSEETRRDLRRAILEETKEEIPVETPYDGEEMRKYLRSHKISINSLMNTALRDDKHSSGGYGDFGQSSDWRDYMRSHAKYYNFRREGGMDVDKVFQEFAELYPSSVDPDLSGAKDQLDAMVEAVENNMPRSETRYATQYGEEQFDQWVDEQIDKMVEDVQKTKEFREKMDSGELKVTDEDLDRLVRRNPINARTMKALEENERIFRENAKSWIPDYDIIREKYDVFSEDVINDAMYETLMYGHAEPETIQDMTKELVDRLDNVDWRVAESLTNEVNEAVEDMLHYFALDFQYKANQKNIDPVVTRVNNVVKAIDEAADIDAEIEMQKEIVDSLKEADEFKKSQGDTDLAAMLINRGADQKTYTWRTLEQNLDYVANGDLELRDRLRVDLELPRSVAQLRRNEIRNEAQKIIDKAKDLGITAGSDESKIAQFYKEGHTNERDVIDTSTQEGIDRKRSNPWKEYTKEQFDTDTNYKMKNGKTAKENIKEVVRMIDDSYNSLILALNMSQTEIYGDVIGQNEYETAQLRAKLERQSKTVEILKEEMKKNDSVEKQGAYNKAVKEYNKLINQLNTKLENDASNDSTRRRFTPLRRNYAHHITKSSLVNDIKGIIKGRDAIPTALNGLSENTLPNTAAAGFMWAQEGGDYIPDLIESYANYVDEASKVLAYNDYIVKLRQITKDLRATATGNEMSRFTDYLEQYANDIAGKRRAIDRAVDKAMPSVGQAIRVANRLGKRAALMFNVNSALVQVANIPNGLGILRRQGGKSYGMDVVKGISDMLNSNREDMKSIMEKSAFMNDRYFDFKTYDNSLKAKIGDLADGMMTIGDKFGANVIWWSAYEQAIRKGMTPGGSKAIFYADDITRRTTAGRGVGEVPLGLRSNFLNTIAPFQVENNNSWQTFKQNVKGKQLGALVTAGVFSYLLNMLFKFLKRDDVLPEALSPVIDQLFSDEDTTIEEKLTNIVKGEIGELLSAIPGGSMLTSLSMSKDKAEQIFGDYNPSRYGMTNIGLTGAGNAFYDAVVKNDGLAALVDLFEGYFPGGKQISRTIGGLQSYGVAPQYKDESGRGVLDLRNNWKRSARDYDKDGNIKFENDPDDFWAMLQAALFGKWASKSAQEYVDNGFHAYGKTATNISELLDEMGQSTYSKMFSGNVTGENSQKFVDKLNEMGIYDEYLDKVNEKYNEYLDTVPENEKPITFNKFANDYGLTKAVMDGTYEPKESVQTEEPTKEESGFDFFSFLRNEKEEISDLYSQKADASAEEKEEIQNEIDKKQKSLQNNVYSNYSSSRKMDEKKTKTFQSAMDLDGLYKDAKGNVSDNNSTGSKKVRNSEAIETRKALEDMGEYESVLDYIAQNGLDYSDFGLTKTVVGWGDSKFDSEYAEMFGGESSDKTSSKASTKTSYRSSGSRSGSRRSRSTASSDLARHSSAVLSRSKNNRYSSTMSLLTQLENARRKNSTLKSYKDYMKKRG